MNVTKTLYPNVAAAMGAWFGGEIAAAIANPADMWTKSGLRRCGKKHFDGVQFEYHLTGLVSDLFDLCAAPFYSATEPVYLCVSPERLTLEQIKALGREVQPCMQGTVWFEGANGE